MSEFYSRKEIEELTGLHFLEIRRMEKAKQFPRRVPKQAYKTRVRWRKDKVDEWLMGYREKLVKSIMGSGIQASFGHRAIFFYSPRGTIFADGKHTKVFVERFEIVKARNAGQFDLVQCPDYPNCIVCKQEGPVMLGGFNVLED